MDLIGRIVLLMQQNGTTGVSLGRELGLEKSPVTDWKNKKSRPTIEQITKMCDFFAISSDYLLFGESKNSSYSKDELKLLELYKKLEDNFKRNALYQITELSYLNDNQGDFKELLTPILKLLDTKKPTNTKTNIISIDFEKPAIRTIPVYSQSASAGTGNFLSSEDYDLIDFDVDILPIQTTFGVRLIGDSMEDKYSSGDVVFVKQQPDLESGQLGVFLLNGDALFKKYYISGNKTSLKSLNNSYPPIRIKESDDLRLIGRVLSSNHDID